MGTWSKWLLAAIAAASVSAVVQPPIERLLSNLDVLTTPGQIMSWLEQIVGEVAFPWIAAGTIGLAIGVWLDPFLSRLDGRRPWTKSARAKILGTRAAWKAAEVIAEISRPMRGEGSYARLLVESALVIQKIEKLGIKAELDDAGSTRDNLARLAHFLELIAPPLQDGDIKSARFIASSLSMRAPATTRAKG